VTVSSNAAAVADADAASTSPCEGVQTVLSVLLVHSSKRGDWVFAKGGHESFESRSECARRELLEEGGVEGVLLAELPAVEFASKKQHLSRMHTFLMQVTRQHAVWAEQAERRRKWVPMQQMDAVLTREETRSVWRMALQQLRVLGYVDEQGRAVFKLPSTEEDAPIMEQQLQQQQQQQPS